MGKKIPLFEQELVNELNENELSLPRPDSENSDELVWKRKQNLNTP